MRVNLFFYDPVSVWNEVGIYPLEVAARWLGEPSLAVDWDRDLVSGRIIVPSCDQDVETILCSSTYSLTPYPIRLVFRRTSYRAVQFSYNGVSWKKFKDNWG